jgi:hypothetical protein
LVALIGLALGCAKSTTGKVSGEVTIDGQLPATGSISLFPVDGRSPTSGAEITAGRYEVEAVFGEFKVEIRVPKIVGQKKLYEGVDSPMKDIMEETLPPRYNDETELRLEIKPGQSRQDFKLTTSTAAS